MRGRMISYPQNGLTGPRCSWQSADIRSEQCGEGEARLLEAQHWFGGTEWIASGCPTAYAVDYDMAASATRMGLLLVP